MTCDPCQYFEICKNQLKGCELYHNKIEGLPIENASVHPEFKWFDLCESGYDRYPTMIHDNPTISVWGDAKMAHESAVGEVLPDEFKPDVESWDWVYARRADKLVGAMGYEMVRAGTSVINFLYIRKAYQRTGIGTQLIQSQFLDEIVLVASAEYASDGFYTKLGFRMENGIAIRD